MKKITTIHLSEFSFIFQMWDYHRGSTTAAYRLIGHSSERERLPSIQERNSNILLVCFYFLNLLKAILKGTRVFHVPYEFGRKKYVRVIAKNTKNHVPKLNLAYAFRVRIQISKKWKGIAMLSFSNNIFIYYY